MKNIQNIIFDLGGVILNIDYHKTIDSFKGLGIKNFDQLFTQAKQENLFDDYEKGVISSKKFLNELKTKFSGNIDEQELTNAWNAMLLDLPNERLRLLEKIRPNYNLSLLSNTNEIHLAAFDNIIKKENNISSLNPYFDKVFFSCRMGMRKPNPEIFLKVCEEMNYLKSETLFIDDSIQHVKGAKKEGLEAFHLEDITILQLFDSNFKLKLNI